MKPKCEARGCANDADWRFIGEGGDLNLCTFHGGSEPVEGWTWIGDDPTAPGVSEEVVES